MQNTARALFQGGWALLLFKKYFVKIIEKIDLKTKPCWRL